MTGFGKQKKARENDKYEINNIWWQHIRILPTQFQQPSSILMHHGTAVLLLHTKRWCSILLVFKSLNSTNWYLWRKKKPDLQFRHNFSYSVLWCCFSNGPFQLSGFWKVFFLNSFFELKLTQKKESLRKQTLDLSRVY